MADRTLGCRCLEWRSIATSRAIRAFRQTFAVATAALVRVVVREDGLA